MDDFDFVAGTAVAFMYAWGDYDGTDYLQHSGGSSNRGSGSFTPEAVDDPYIPVDTTSEAKTLSLGTDMYMEYTTETKAADYPATKYYLKAKLVLQNFAFGGVTTGEGLWLAIAFNGARMGTQDGVICKWIASGTITDDNMSCEDMKLNSYSGLVVDTA